MEGREGKAALIAADSRVGSSIPSLDTNSIQPIRLAVSHPRDLALDDPCSLATGDLQIVMRLKIDPKLRGCIEKPGKPKCRIGRDTPFALDDPCNSIDRYAQGLGQRISGKLAGSSSPLGWSQRAPLGV